MAVRFGVSAAALQRHRQNCLNLGTVPKARSAGENTGLGREKTRPAPRKQSEQAESARFVREQDDEGISGPQDLLKRLARLFRIGDLLDSAIDAGKTDEVVKLAREYRQLVESYAKVSGWLTEGAVNFRDARQQTIAIIGALSEDEIREKLATLDRMLPSGTIHQEALETT